MIFVVDDEQNVRTLVERMVQYLGYPVASAGTAEEALDKLRGLPSVSLLLTDVLLPGGLHGVALAERARALHPGLKVLFMSGYPRNHFSGDQTLDADTHLISKPFRREELAQRLRALLSAS
ncbi:MAG: response regulator [Candidatus Lambdaproteobacteria bacterium]|nr:response regulator [Candidatus Lambdaproteobacteria bacterium]